MSDYEKGIQFANQLITAAQKERDTKGYREGLGWELDCKLMDYMQGLDGITYSEKFQILTIFYKKCDNI